MCTQFKNETVTDWIDRQIAVLDCWLESETLCTGVDTRLMETLQIHTNWLKVEREIVHTRPPQRLMAETTL